MTDEEKESLRNIEELVIKIISGEAPFNRNRENYLLNVVQSQIENAELIRDLLEDIDFE